MSETTKLNVNDAVLEQTAPKHVEGQDDALVRRRNREKKKEMSVEEKMARIRQTAAMMEMATALMHMSLFEKLMNDAIENPEAVKLQKMQKAARDERKG